MLLAYLGHHPADSLLHRGAGMRPDHTGHDLLQLQQRQRVPEGPQELLHPVLQLQRDQSISLRPAGGVGAATQPGWGSPNTLSRPGPVHSSSQELDLEPLEQSRVERRPLSGRNTHLASPTGGPIPHPGHPNCQPCKCGQDIRLCKAQMFVGCLLCQMLFKDPNGPVLT